MSPLWLAVQVKKRPRGGDTKTKARGKSAKTDPGAGPSKAKPKAKKGAGKQARLRVAPCMVTHSVKCVY